MKYKFHAYGHPNILASHKTTLEFTKDDEVSLRGACIVGVKSDFELERLKKFIKESKNNRISITISNNKIHDTIFATINHNFNDKSELVVRKTNFISRRTFAINSDRAAADLSRKLMAGLKEKKCKITVSLEAKPY